MKEIIELKNQLKELLSLTRAQIEAENQRLIDIEDFVEQAGQAVEKGNEELRQAALIKNNNNKMKLQFLFGGVLGALDTFVNVIPWSRKCIRYFFRYKSGGNLCQK